MIQRFVFVALSFTALLLTAATACAADPPPIKLLFLGDQGHHQPMERFKQLAPVMQHRGIELTYTERMDDLNAKTLKNYDGLVIYANTVEIKPEQEQGLLDYVESGHGFIPLHCASYCFLNSPKYIDLVGAQFLRHGTGTFRTQLAEPDHELLRGFKGFESWDETYVHTKHNDKDRTVLEYRAEGDKQEPWTWVRTQGKGRVFYTAWGHDERTWSNPGFHNLVERGIRWAVGQDPQMAGLFADKPAMTAPRTDVKPFEFAPARVPFYPAGEKWGTTSEPLNKMQKPLEPAESLKHYVMPQGFHLELFAAEPEIGKPLAMNWDERGRLWLAETVDYPNEMQPPGKGRDRIRICEDTNGDGKADKFTIFAEKLSIPTSLLCVQGGLIVHQAPDTLFLKDTDGDDVADERRVLFTGWGTGDTHAGPSNLQYGFDNWIYGMVGYSGFNGTIGGEQHSFRQGFYRFRPDGSKLEFLRNTNNNSWGVGFNEEGILFGSTANGNPSEYMPIPNRYYEQVRGWSSSVLGGIAESNKFYPITDKIRQVDHHGGFTAAAGHALYTARTYPREYWNRTAFVCEPTGNLVATFVIDPQGAGYRSKNAWNLLASDDEWASPIMAEVGPDGNVWVLDWYNFIVQHNPTPAGFKTGKGAAYETELRDKKHARIYRLVYDQAQPANVKSLHNAPPDVLVKALANDNLFWRRQAQRLLVERGERDVVPQLLNLLHDETVDATGLNAGAVHALWTLAGLGVLNDPPRDVSAAVEKSLTHSSAAVRRNALTVLPRDPKYAPAIAKLTQDRDGQVQLAAWLALADLPRTSDGAVAALAVIEALQQSDVLRDRWLLDALTSAGARHDFAVLTALSQLGGKQAFSKPALDRIAIIAESYARGNPDNYSALLASLPQSSPDIADVVIAGLLKGWPRDSSTELDDAGRTGLIALFAKVSPNSRANLVSLAERWNSNVLEKYSAQIAEQFAASVADDSASDADRVSAAAQLITFKKSDAKTVELLLAQLGPRTSPALAQGLIEALAKSEAKSAGEMLVARLDSITPAVRPAAIRVLLGRSDWTAALVDGIEAGQLQLSDLALDQRQALAVHPDKEIAAKAKKLLAAGGGLPNADRQKVLEELMPLTEKQGDVALGKLVFTAQCAKCHRHNGEGAQIGPDLTGMAVHPKHELLMHVIDPSRSVEGNFRVYTVVMEDGRVFTGLLASETKTSVELIDSEGKTHPLLRDEIEELVASPKSLMPEGFEKQVKPEEIVNLLEFLTHKGKYVPLPLDKIASVVTTRGMFYSADADAERLILSDWSPRTVEDVPFVLVDPQGDRKPNAVMLYGPTGYLPPKMPKSVSLPCNTAAKAIHFLSGVSGWGFPASGKGSVSMIVRLHYADGQTEDHELKNGEEFADYIHRVDVPGSKFAFAARGQQVRYLSVAPKRSATIESIDLVKGPDNTAPVVLAVTVETRSAE
jgi:putative membrane-bound dehydrogenase-like protein